ncbi:BatD family protein [Beggiatoa leptomitoformis]|uniref:Protein BatD n=1 Tax=Beggiatoa leptomitoformis TaxID=288004 RepID=A0A2N9YCG5_9GAMM|nr:BatD family protein [Beggiatoa leptomitoformis]ALG66543.1 hypothetical protein AL038_00820 [Beggiatoa leptomitoformis]AUI68158.1 hypothetical protein BLE401_05225 [Beggiatoa leptomitoformis]
MKTTQLFCIWTLCCLAFPLSAATQLHVVSEPNRLVIGQLFRLRITLLDASESDIRSSQSPDMRILPHSFSVKDSQRIVPPPININGEMRRQIIWQYTLEAQQAGTFTLPAFSLPTTVGVVYSPPLPLIILDEAKQAAPQFILETKISNPNPYLYEPIYYTLRLYYQGELRDLQPTPPSDGVIMEHLGNPMGKVIQNHREVINNQEVIIGEVVYLLTPLRTGALTLEASKMTGLRPDEQHNILSHNTNFSTINYLPVEINSRPIELNVQTPPPNAPALWLPLKKLTLTQTWTNNIQPTTPIGVPLLFTITLTAEGMGGQALPNLKDLLTNTQDFRIRSPSPERQRTLATTDGKTPVNKITQQFSITPLKAGELPLPQLKIQWWDTENKTFQLTELPSQTLQVIDNTPIIQPENTPAVTQHFHITAYIYESIIALCGLLLSWGIYYRWTHSPQKLSARYWRKQWQTIEDIFTFQQQVQHYAQITWQVAPPATFSRITQTLQKNYVGHELLIIVCKTLESAIYGKQPIDIPTLRQQWLIGLHQLRYKKQKKQRIITLNTLNPSP